MTRIRGELLEVRDTTLLVLRDGARVTAVPIHEVRSGAFAKLGMLIENGELDEDDRERLRLVSRYPKGLSPELAAQLLAAYGQTEPDRVTVQGTTPDDFLAQARRGTARYQSADSARAAGYRPVGPDFPGMGRHWVHPALILQETPDATQPAVLEYAEISGRPTLVGVAYAVLVKDGAPPTALPVPPEAWHFHQGTVEEESFLRSHAGLGHELPGPKIAVLHAWIWLDNPDGVFATDNWVLPYARLGLRAAPDASRTAARALALAAGDGGRSYLEALIHAVGQPSDEETQLLTEVVSRHQAMARAHAPHGVKLEACWSALWDDVKTTVRPEVWERLLRLHPLEGVAQP